MRSLTAIARVMAIGAAALVPGCSKDQPALRGLGILSAAPNREIEAPDFVRATRKEGAEFMPVGVSAPPRPVRARTDESRKALEAELGSARDRNVARGRAADAAGRSVGKASGGTAPVVPTTE